MLVVVVQKITPSVTSIPRTSSSRCTTSRHLTMNYLLHIGLDDLQITKFKNKLNFINVSYYFSPREDALEIFEEINKNFVFQILNSRWRLRHFGLEE